MIIKSLKKNYSSKLRSLIKIEQPSNWALVGLTIFNIFLFWKPLAKEEFKVNIQNELLIQQRLGNLYFYQFINIKNLGEKAGFITKIEGFIRSKDRDENVFRRKIEAKNISNVPFLELLFIPHSNDNEQLTLFKDEDRITKDSIHIIEALMLNEEQQFEAKSPERSLQSYIASKRLSSIIERFIKTRANELKGGEYEYIVEVTKNNEAKPFYERCFSFIIYPGNIFLLNENVKDFKRYNTILRNQWRPSLQIPLTEITNPDIIKSLEQEFMK